MNDKMKTPKEELSEAYDRLNDIATDLDDTMQAIDAIIKRLGVSTAQIPGDSTLIGCECKGQDKGCDTWGYGTFVGIIQPSGKFVLKMDDAAKQVYDICEII